MLDSHFLGVAGKGQQKRTARIIALMAALYPGTTRRVTVIAFLRRADSRGLDAASVTLLLDPELDLLLRVFIYI